MRTARRMSQTAWPWKPTRTATSGASDGAGAFAALAACLAIGSRFRAAWPASFRLSGSPAFRATRQWPANRFPWRYRSDLQRVAVTAATNWTGLIRRWSPLIWSRASLSGSVRDAGILVAGAEDTRRALCPPRRGRPQCLSLSRAGRRKAPFEPPPLSSDRAFERELVVRSRTSAWGQTEKTQHGESNAGLHPIAEMFADNWHRR
jgi:hypothetical protein